MTKNSFSFVYIIDMSMTSKSTNVLRAELKGIQDKISAKIREIIFTHQKLPFDRLSKGRHLKDLVILCINAIDDGNEEKLKDYIDELKNKGVELKNFNYKQ